MITIGGAVVRQDPNQQSPSPDYAQAFREILAAYLAQIPGVALYRGSGAPNNALGNPGDFYINTDAVTLYGPKQLNGWDTSNPTRLQGAIRLSELADLINDVKMALTAPDLDTVRARLGLAIGSAVQKWDVDLDAISALTTTAFGRSLLTQADAPTVRTTLALGSAALLAAGQSNGAATLDSGGKLTANQIPDAVLGAVRYQGGWNAAANVPTLPTPAAANRGFYYIVTTAGTTSLPGPNGAITDWQIGDWAVSDGTYWEKVDSSDQVISVAGLQGAITAPSLKTALAISVSDVSGLQAALDKRLRADGAQSFNNTEVAQLFANLGAAPSTAGYVLTSNGPGVPPTFKQNTAAASGAILYNAAQNLAGSDILVAKKNLRTEIGRRYYTKSNNGNSATVVLTQADLGGLVYLESDITAVTVPLAGNYTDGDYFWLYCRGTVTVSATSGDPYTFGFADFNRPSFVMQPGDRCKVVMGADAWDVMSYTTTHGKALLADRPLTFTDAERGQLLNNIGMTIPQTQCRLVLKDAATLSLVPVTGFNVFINGRFRAVPAAGVNLGISGLSLNVLYYIYAYWDGTNVVLIASTNGIVRDSTWGILTPAGTPSYTLVGMAYPVTLNGTTSFADQTDYRCVASYYQRQRKSIYVGFATGQAGSSYVEYGTRAYFLSWGEDHTDIGMIGFAYTSQTDNQIFYMGADGNQVGPIQQTTAVANSSASISQNMKYPFGIGLHYLQLFARSGGSTMNVNHAKTGSVLL